MQTLESKLESEKALTKKLNHIVAQEMYNGRVPRTRITQQVKQIVPPQRKIKNNVGKTAVIHKIQREKSEFVENGHKKSIEHVKPAIISEIEKCVKLAQPRKKKPQISKISQDLNQSEAPKDRVERKLSRYGGENPIPEVPEEHEANEDEQDPEQDIDQQLLVNNKIHGRYQRQQENNLVLESGNPDERLIGGEQKVDGRLCVQESQLEQNEEEKVQDSGENFMRRDRNHDESNENEQIDPKNDAPDNKNTQETTNQAPKSAQQPYKNPFKPKNPKSSPQRPVPSPSSKFRDRITPPSQPTPPATNPFKKAGPSRSHLFTKPASSTNIRLNEQKKTNNNFKI